MRYFDHRFPLNGKCAQRPEEAVKDPLALHRLLEKQHYRLAFWRVASDEINYRRFFEITDLAGVRVEDQDVFEATHALIAQARAAPAASTACASTIPTACRSRAVPRAAAASSFERPWVVVEKILADHETLPADWPVHGTTGYRFANLLTGLFVDQRRPSALRPHLPALHAASAHASRRSPTRAAC